ncbi:MAG: hypothetical protein HYX75_16620 [Acidobacteria bacterium]|nr:hypothetical protein [Acidobacteriota bacterium]
MTRRRCVRGMLMVVFAGLIAGHARSAALTEYPRSRVMQLREGEDWGERLKMMKLAAQFKGEKPASFVIKTEDGKQYPVELKRVFTPMLCDTPLTTVADVESGVILGALDYFVKGSTQPMRFYLAMGKQAGQWKAIYLDGNGKALNIPVTLNIDEQGLKSYYDSGKATQGRYALPGERVAVTITGDHSEICIVASGWGYSVKACAYTNWNACWLGLSFYRSGSNCYIRASGWWGTFDLVTIRNCPSGWNAHIECR